MATAKKRTVAPKLSRSAAAMQKVLDAVSLDNVENMKETMLLISRVMQKCEGERAGRCSIKWDQAVERAVKYTGLHKDVIAKIAKLLGSGSDSVIAITMEDIDPMLIRNEMMNFYLNKQILPTTKQLFDALQNKIPMNVDIRMLRKTLLKLNYMWKMYPNYNLVIIERPTSVFERYHYLKQIIEYREENRSIIFLDVCLLNSKGDLVMMNKSQDPNLPEEERGYFMYGASKHQVFGLKAERASTFSKTVFEEWIRDVICFHIPPKSVVVMNTVEYNNEEIKKLPTFDSFKVEMIEWLEYHNIPCSPNMCKTELFSLIEKFTNTVNKLYKIDKILKFYGHDVLRVPNSINDTTLTYFIRGLVTSNYRVTSDEPIDVDKSWDKFESVHNIFNKLNEELLKQFDDITANQERVIFNNDTKLDAIFDELCEDMNRHIYREDEEDSDIPTLSDSD